MLQDLPEACVLRLAAHLTLKQQRLLGLFDPRFAEAADTDWSIPLLQRVSRLAGAMELSDKIWNEQLILFLDTKDRDDPYTFNIRRRRAIRGLSPPIQAFELSRNESESRKVWADDKVLHPLDQTLSRPPTKQKLYIRARKSVRK